MDDALSRSEPLHVAATEARRRAQRIGMVDEALPHERDRLEASMRVLWEARNDAAVVHPPSVGPGEVHAEVACCERRRRPHVLVRFGIQVEVVHAEQERVQRRPLDSERHRLEHGISHARSLRGAPILQPRSAPSRAGRWRHRAAGAAALRRATEGEHRRRLRQIQPDPAPELACVCPFCRPADARSPVRVGRWWFRPVRSVAISRAGAGRAKRKPCP